MMSVAGLWMSSNFAIAAKKFFYGFDANFSTFRAWLALVSHVIPREIAAECRASGLFDLDGTIKWGSFWESIGRPLCHEATKKNGQRFVFRSHDEAIDTIFSSVDEWPTHKVKTRGREEWP